MTEQMKSWEVATEAWDAFNAEEFMSNGIQAVYEAGKRAALAGDAILAAGFRRGAPAEPAVTDEMVERATHAAYMAGLGSYLNMFALGPKIRAALEAALSTERGE